MYTQIRPILFTKYPLPMKVFNTESAVYTVTYPNQSIWNLAILVDHQYISNVDNFQHIILTLAYLSWWLWYSPMFDQKIQSFPALLCKTIASQHSVIPTGRRFWENLVVTFPNNGDNHGRIVSKNFEKKWAECPFVWAVDKVKTKRDTL